MEFYGLVLSAIITYMFDFHEKRKLRSLLYSIPSLVLLGIIVLLLLYSVWGVFQKERETQTKKEIRSEVLEGLLGRETELQTEIDRFNTKRGIEEEIISRFDVARPGEQVLILVDVPPKVDTNTFGKQPNLFQRFLNIFR